MKTCDRSDVYPNSEENEITVFSWNLLAPTLAKGGLDWQTVRLPVFREWLIRFVACDVMCFQEVDVNHSLADISEFLSTYGFTAVVQERQGFPVVNATFFKSSRLKIKWTQHRSRALLVNFSSTTGDEVCVVNVHLEAGSESQRKCQLASALKRMQGSAKNIICGDFNCRLSTGSPLGNQLAEAGLVRAPTKGITWCWTERGRADIFDHIWASESLVPFRILSSSDAFLDRIRASGMANSTYPSDHLPVAASFWFALQLPQEKDSIPSLEVPTLLDVNTTEEWVQISRIGSLCSGKKANREQRKLEAAFLSTMSEEDAEKLRGWRKAAAAVAQALVCGAVQNVLTGNRKAEAIPCVLAKPCDPGKQTPADDFRSLGGA
jgi:endonuclease/exonuclease/phosphatase family metal-dependent hydrolase